MVKVFYLKQEKAEEKLSMLEKKIAMDEELQTNKNKRKRILHQIAQLKKAIEEPEKYLVDPEKYLEKVQVDKKRRIEKKVQKKKEIVKQIKNEKRHAKRCLKCGSREHLLEECEQKDVKIGTCFKCGARDHTHR